MWRDGVYGMIRGCTHGWYEFKMMDTWFNLGVFYFVSRFWMHV